MQNSAKMAPSTSSTSIRPVRRPRWRAARRSSSALSSGLNDRSPKRSRAASAAVELRAVAGPGQERRPCPGFSGKRRVLRQRRDQSRRCPSPVLAETLTASLPAPASGARSILFNTAISARFADVCADLPGERSGGHVPLRRGGIDQPQHRDRRPLPAPMPALSPRPRPCLRASRKPAVSISMTGTPPRSRCTSMTSRVVPASSDTIATSRLASAFNRARLAGIGRTGDHDA